jgi:hypothetical protein
MPNHPNQDGPHSELLCSLFAQNPSTKHYEGHYIGPKGTIETAAPIKLLEALGIRKEALSPIALGALESVEELGREVPEDWERFLWSLAAFTHIQDLFECPLQEGGDIKSLFQQYYFYYESKSILVECILAWLDGLYIASGTLLRPFLEFSLYQNYYIRVMHDGTTYRPLEKYFKDQIQPGQSKAIRHAMPQDKFCRPIRFRINAHLSALSNISQHVYHPDASTFQHRCQPLGHSVEGLFFWKDIHMILECALWIYYANSPTAFFPIDVLRKFGFNGPVGIFADHWTAKIIKSSLSPDDYFAFKQYAEPQAIETISWGQSHQDLSNVEIFETWDSQNSGPCPTDLTAAYYTHVARFRAMRAALAFRPTKNAPQISSKALSLLGSLDGWSTLSKRSNKQ